MIKPYDCDIVIPVFNRPQMTVSCLDSICARTTTPYRMIIIDNGSGAETKSALEGFRKSHANVTIITNESNLGWVKAVNRGMASSNAPYICIMNNDTVVETADWLKKLIDVAQSQADIGLVNPEFGDSKKPDSPARPFIEIDFCRGYCILIKRSVVDRIGSLDESYGLGYYDDDDYSVRAIRAGFRCVRVRDVVVRHLRDSTFSDMFARDQRAALHQKNKELFYARWGRRLRLAFMLTKNADRDRSAEVLLSLARRQHVIYLWNLGRPLGIAHINVREYRPWPMIAKSFFLFDLRLNNMKKDAKRYSAVFVDDELFCRRLGPLAKGGLPVYCFDLDKEAGRIGPLVDSIAKA